VPLCTLASYLGSFVPFVFVHVQYLLNNSGLVIIIFDFRLTWIVWAKSGFDASKNAFTHVPPADHLTPYHVVHF